MSATIHTIITCDGAGKNCTGNDWSADQSRMSAKRQRESAGEFGWVYVKKKDYCPNCWKELKYLYDIVGNQ